MNMKKIYAYILLAATLMLSACSGFLDIRKEATVPTSGMDYSNSQNIFQPVSAAYAAMRWSSFQSNEGISLSYLTLNEIISDDAEKGSESADGPDIKEIDEFRFTPTNPHINTVWIKFFDIVSAANYAIEAMDRFTSSLQNEDDLAYAAKCKGEAFVIRAYAYFNLVRLFGTVPVIKGTMSSEELAAMKVSSVEEIYKFIYQDLDAAIAALPEKWDGYDGRYDVYTARALKAKVALYNKDWNEAAAQADEIIACERFSLLPDFRQVFAVEGENSSESLMEIQSTCLGQTAGAVPATSYSYVQGPRQNQPSNMQGWGFNVPSSSLVKFLKDRGDEIRYATTILERGTVTPEGDAILDKCANPYYNGKVYTPSRYNIMGNNSYGLEHNVRVIRYADILLIYAEALGNSAPVGAKSGKSADDALNEVRTRAGLGTVSDTLDNIYEERRAELAMEENRFFDLVRWGKAAEVLGPLGFKAGKNEVFPIPSSQRQLNPNLPATTGYTY